MDLDSLASQIRQKQAFLQEKSRHMREKVLKLEKKPLNISVCAVDGGLLAHRMHGIDIAVARAVGVNFIYEDSRLKSCDYYPSKSPRSSVEVQSALDEHEALVFRSLVRLKHELGCAIEVIGRYSPQIMLLDGSLLPVPSDIPSKESTLYPLYKEVLAFYGELHSSGTLLCGVIKDSRAKRLSKDCTDSVLCNYLLEECERTIEMEYFESKTPNKEVSLAENIKVFYIKPSKNDLPLRIEVLGDTEQAAQLICSLSAISEHFAYPAILVEADMCAALDPAELQQIENSLQSKAGIRPLRRNLRPFR